MFPRMKITAFELEGDMSRTKVRLLRDVPPALRQTFADSNEMEVNAEFSALLDYYTGQSTGLIQELFPDLSPEEREFVLTGTTPEEWNKVFGPPTVDPEAC